MAQQDDKRRSTTADAADAPRPQNSPGSKSSKTQTSPNCQNLKGGGSSWSPNSSSKSKQNHDQDDHGNHHHKKSVFMKVKEKARKLKKSISGRKCREDNDLHSPYITPPGSAGSVHDDDKDRPEYFGTPLYEPQGAPNTNKQSEKQHSQESNKGKHDLSKDQTPSLDADSKQSGLGVANHEEKENQESSMQPQDKGVSVKEYIMHKLEPGDDERALSQVITQTISPKCEKVKEAMNSLIRSEEASDQSTSKNTKVELDVTPSSSLASHPNLSDTRESNLSNASSMSQCSPTASASLQNQNLGSSNLKPNSG